MYCAPTSFTNWFAYLSNRGIPQALTLDGARAWEDNANYSHVMRLSYIVAAAFAAYVAWKLLAG